MECFGFVFTSLFGSRIVPIESILGKLNREKIRSMLQENQSSLQQHHITDGDVFRLLQRNQTVTLPNGTQIHPQDPLFCLPDANQKKVVLLGDTSNAR